MGSVDYQAFIDAGKDRDSTKEIKLPRIGAPFKIRTMSEDELTKLRKSCTTFKKVNGVSTPDMDSDLFQQKMIVAGVVEPDLSNAQLQESLGTVGDTIGTLKAILRAGEFSTIGAQILEFSGFNEDIMDLKDEVKNESMTENSTGI